MNETDFGYRIRQALNEGLEHLDYKTTYKLQQARQAALASLRPAQADALAWQPALATPHGSMPAETGRASWLHRLGLAAPLLALTIGIIGIYQYQDARRISDLADLDFAVLLDEVPIDAYASKGFGALLQGETENP